MQIIYHTKVSCKIGTLQDKLYQILLSTNGRWLSLSEVIDYSGEANRRNTVASALNYMSKRGDIKRFQITRTDKKSGPKNIYKYSARKI